jgi:hypothetical protein
MDIVIHTLSDVNLMATMAHGHFLVQRVQLYYITLLLLNATVTLPTSRKHSDDMP